jgi:hypothetical protein
MNSIYLPATWKGRGPKWVLRINMVPVAEIKSHIASDDTKYYTVCIVGKHDRTGSGHLHFNKQYNTKLEAMRRVNKRFGLPLSFGG